MPLGTMVKPSEPIFLPTAMKPDYATEDEYIPFFEPDSNLSRRPSDQSLERIALRMGDRSPPIPEATDKRMLSEATDPSSPFPDPEGVYNKFYTSTDISAIASSGDHEVVFPSSPGMP